MAEMPEMLVEVQEPLFNLYNCKNMRDAFSVLHTENQFVIDKTGCKMLEVLNASFVADKFSVFGVIDEKYLAKELSWYNTQIQNIEAMYPPVPKLWKDSAGHQGQTNSNYGWAIYNSDNYNQFDNVLHELRMNSFSRRAVMIYTRPSMWVDFKEDGKNDFMCTNNVQYFIRNMRLETQVYMRSNDAVFGYNYDRYWQMLVRDRLFKELLNTYPMLKRGSIMWNAGSFHIYERHFYLVNHYIETGNPHITKEEYDLRKNNAN